MLLKPLGYACHYGVTAAQPGLSGIPILNGFHMAFYVRGDFVTVQLCGSTVVINEIGAGRVYSCPGSHHFSYNTFYTVAADSGSLFFRYHRGIEECLSGHVSQAYHFPPQIITVGPNVCSGLCNDAEIHRLPVGSGQALPALFAATGDDSTAILSGHTKTEAVLVHFLPVGRLKGSFHDVVPFSGAWTCMLIEMILGHFLKLCNIMKNMKYCQEQFSRPTFSGKTPS